MISTFDALEVHDHITDNLGCLNGTIIWTGFICCAHQQRDRDLVNASNVNQGSLTLTLHIVRSVLLESVHEGILIPMGLCLDSNRLAIVTVSKVACVVAELFADFFVLLLPVRTVQVVDTDRSVCIQPIVVVGFRLVGRADRAGSESHELIKVVD